jgi:hypothetical protein
MTDEHQVHAIIAAAITECQKEHPDRRVDPEEAKLTAKCIIAALTDAGLQIVIAAKD